MKGLLEELGKLVELVINAAVGFVWLFFGLAAAYVILKDVTKSWGSWAGLVFAAIFVLVALNMLAESTEKYKTRKRRS